MTASRTWASFQHWVIGRHPADYTYPHSGGLPSRNIRTIGVLVDRDAITSGDVAIGDPWQHDDLGRGHCACTFFEQCPHRLGCARCDFYTPKNSSKAQLLEAKDNLQRMLATHGITDEERDAIDDGQAALNSLFQRRVDVPTPVGPTAVRSPFRLL